MVDSNYNKWKTNKPLLAGSFTFLVIFGFILISSIYSFLNLRKVEGAVSTLKIDKQSGTYLTMKLRGDNRIYYQEYKKRFIDQEALKLHQNEKVYFFTFKNPEKRRGAISSLGDQSSFLYWPVFNINEKAGILQVFYFYVYNNLIIELLLAISLVLVLYNGFYIFLKTNWFMKTPLLLLALLMAWLWF